MWFILPFLDWCFSLQDLKVEEGGSGWDEMLAVSFSTFGLDS